jgi:hypothetical protein
MQPNDLNTSPTNDTNQDSATEPTVAAPVTPVNSTPQFPAAQEPTATSVVSPTVNSAPMAPAVAATSTTGKSGFLKSKKAKLTALVVGLVLLLGGGGAAAYYGVILPNQPQRIAQQAISNTLNQENVKSGSFEGEVTFTGGEIADTLSSISFNGSSSDKGAVNLTVTANTMVTKINLDVRSSDSKTFYARLSGLDGLDQLLAAYAASYQGSSTDESAAMLTALAPIITNINNQWYSVDESMLSQLGGNLGVATSENKVSEADAKKVGEIYKKHQFLEINEKLADEKIHDIDSYHIVAKINKDKLVAFLNELKAANIQSLSVDQSMIDQVSKVDFSKYPFDVWVSKADRLITQLATTIEQDGTTMKLRVALFDVNKEVKVEAPTDAKTILELLTEFAPLAAGYMGGGAPASDTPLELNEQ